MSNGKTAAAKNAKKDEVVVVSADTDVTGLAGIVGNLDAAFAKKTTLINLSAKYLNLSEGESKKLVYVKILENEDVDEETGEIEKVQNVLFIDEDKVTTWVARNVQIINAMKGAPEGSTFLITYTGEADLGKGRRMKEFDCVLLG